MIKLSEEGEAVLRRGMQALEMDLEHWNQSYYVNPGASCGTTACLAGQIVANELGMTLDVLANWERYHYLSGKALELLGLSGDDGEEGDDAGSFRELIFYYTHTEDDRSEENLLARTPENLKLFKERIAQVTGIEL